MSTTGTQNPTPTAVKKPKRVASLWIVLGIFGTCFFMAFCTMLIVFGVIGSSSQNFVDSLPVDETTGLKSWAMIHWDLNGLKVAVQTLDTYKADENYDWSLKVVVASSAKLVSQSPESDSGAGPLTLVSDNNEGTFIFAPTYASGIADTIIRHNFGFTGVDIGPGNKLKLYLVIHMPSGDHDVPIHIVYP
ncbi:hypothetical protein KAZ57_02195 [Patescibacteria group bacterium]|nr:hypothetical protein [Patescibacteria group bacterium]